MNETMSVSDTVNGDPNQGGGDGNHVPPGDGGGGLLPPPVGWVRDLRGPPILESLLLLVSSFWYMRETIVEEVVL